MWKVPSSYINNSIKGTLEKFTYLIAPVIRLQPNCGNTWKQPMFICQQIGSSDYTLFSLFETVTTSTIPYIYINKGHNQRNTSGD